MTEHGGPLRLLGGDGPPVVISHATGFAGGAYAPLADCLGVDFEVWAIDHRGHGEFGYTPGSDMGYETMASDLLEAMASVELERPAVFGHSMGGAVALLAERQRPGTFRSIYVYEPAIVPAAPANERHTLNWVAAVRRRRDRFGSLEEAMTFFATRDPYRQLRSDALLAYVQHGLGPAPEGGLQLRCRPEDEASCYEQNRWPAMEFSGLEMPLTVAFGSDDSFGVGLVPPPLAAVLRHAHAIEYPGLGHFGPLEAPGAVALDVAAAFANPETQVRAS